MSRVLQVLQIFEIWICHIFEFCWPPKVTSTLSKQLTEHDGDGDNNKVYLDITDNLYHLVHVIIRLDGSQGHHVLKGVLHLPFFPEGGERMVLFVKPCHFYETLLNFYETFVLTLYVGLSTN